MKKLLFSAAVAALFFTACKKDDDNSNKGSFTVNGKTYVTNYGYESIDASEGNGWGDIAFFSDNLTTLNSDTYTGTVHYVDLGIDTLIDGATYTYLSSGNASYDKTKNFYYAEVEANMKLVNGSWVSSADEVELYSPNSGTVTVKKSGSNYTVSYNLKYDDNVTVTGSYSGTLSKD